MAKKKDRRLIRQRRKAYKAKREQYFEELALKKVSDIGGVATPIYKAQSSDPLTRIQDTLKYIQDNNLHRKDILSNQLSYALRSMIGDMGHNFIPGESNPYFTISSSWDGDASSLISNVSIHNLSTANDKALSALMAITNSEWGSKARHDAALKEGRHAGWSKNIESLNKNLNSNMVEQLEQLMNSSKMWRFIVDKYNIKNRKYKEVSDSAKDEWVRIYNNMSRTLTKVASKAEQSELDKIITIINNPSQPTSDLTNYLDELLKKYV